MNFQLLGKALIRINSVHAVHARRSGLAHALLGAMLLAAPAGAAHAEPGLATEIYGPGVQRGQAELEVRSGFLNGGANQSDWQVKTEAGYAFTDWWRPAIVGEWENEGGDTDFTALAIENIIDFTPTREWPVHFGFYAEYEWAQTAPDDKVEIKLLMERERGPLDLRLNLVGEHILGSDQWEYGYAAEGAYQLTDDVKIGVQGFGDAGDSGDFGRLGDHAHYWGPFTQFEIGHINDGEVEMQLGYLKGFGDAEADGQIRVQLEYEFGGGHHEE